jgi:threonylcarbamoyladenosine tRNA methylthiotransferase MtaB
MRVLFTNLGCKLNQAENDRLARDFAAAGHEIVTTLAAADLHVVNSCTVTATAAASSRKAARAAARAALRASPGPSAGGEVHRVRTVLTGCYATASPDAAASLAGVDLVVANADKDRLLDRVQEAFPLSLPGYPEAPAKALLPRTVPPSLEPPGAGPPSAVAPGAALPAGNTRAFLKVEDGCDMRCSFCIIPATRGRQRSRPLPEVVEEADRLIREGHREIVVTGVQISAYRDASGSRGGGDDRPRCLADLVRALLAALPPPAAAPPGGGTARAAPAARLRLTSIAPWQLDGELLGLWSDRRLCRHLHLSLQSGATATLRRMRRPYTAAGYARLIRCAQAAVPGLAVTTDVIVGFPGETAAEFEESLAAVAALGFARVHVFPYSPRPGTAAAALAAPVPEAERQRRMARMLAAAAAAERAFHAAHLGHRATVLWERPKDGRGQGLTDNYIRVFCPDAAGLRGQLSDVELVGLTAGGMVGRLAAPP